MYERGGYTHRGSIIIPDGLPLKAEGRRKVLVIPPSCPSLRFGISSSLTEIDTANMQMLEVARNI
jgi:hypothetical protein